MDEAILLPSPNWFLVSGLAVTVDGWVIYGGPSKSLCVLEPLNPDSSVIVSEKGYRTHYYPKVHGDKITSIDISPTWSEKKSFISGSTDGTVKLWNLEKVDNEINLKYTLSHSMHSNEREDVVGVGYSTNIFAITVGSFGRIVKWDLQSNVVKTYNLILSRFKPTCMACSPHMSLQVAVGTKQGVVLVLDLNDTGTTLFKVRSHDEEVLSMSWCPQFSVPVKKFFKDFEPKYSANKRMERIRQELTNENNEELDDSALSKTLPEDSFDETVVEEEDLFDVYKDHAEDEFGHKKYTPEVIVVKEKEAKSTEFDYLAECQNLKDKILKNKDEPEPSINSLVDALDKTHVDDSENKSFKGEDKKKGDSASSAEFSKQNQKHLLATIGRHGQLRVWSKYGKLLGNCVIQNKNFVPNKYQPKVSHTPWASLLWYKPDVLLITDARGQLLQCDPLTFDSRGNVQTSCVDAIHKRGTFCIVSNAPRVQHGYGTKVCNKKENGNQTHTGTESKDSEQIESNQEDNKEDNEKDNQKDNQEINKQSNAKDVLSEDDWFIWTAAQDRTLVCFSMTQRKKICTYHSCGGYVYNIQTCPYDAKKVAMCVGDGAVRVWEANFVEDNDEKIAYGHVTSYWQNVQGKVLVAAWHPTRENLLAFATAESRVGLLDVGTASQEKPARVLNVGVTGSVYSLCWGERNDLYVSGGGDIVLCNLKKERDSKTISVELEGERWRLSAVSWYPAGLLVGSALGAVALLHNTTHQILAVNFVFKKLINSLEWHPPYTSSSSEESSLKNLVAVCSMDKCAKIAILKHSQSDDGKHELASHKYLEGHKGTVLQLAWSPHHEGRLASTSSDLTARVWDVTSGMCISIYPGTTYYPISIAWSAFPRLADCLISGGVDHSVRLWRLGDYPPEAYKEVLPISLLPKREKRKILAKKSIEQEEVIDKSAEEALDSEPVYGEGREADQMALKLKAFKRFLLPISSKQMSNITVVAARKLADKVMGIEREASEKESTDKEYDIDFLKMFGSTNEINELLDYEMEHHLQCKDTDAWMMLAVFRGQMDAMVQFAAERDLLCPFLVSLAPCVSYKYWKDVTQLYLAQINRSIAQKQDYKMKQSAFGGVVFRKAALTLALHDVRGAVDCMLDAKLFREAYVLCRARHMESVARDILHLWLKEATSNGHTKLAIICHLALGDFYKASTTIVAGVSEDDETWLSLAADLAKMAGQHTFAGHIEEKKDQIKQTPSKEMEETLQQLPSRIELLLKNCGIKNENGDGNGLQDEGSKNGSDDVETKEAKQVE